ncbi:MAG: RnfABCDGE type electron transport complex subunit D [Firmicutes bacterium]|nr:RnfABCDGE type electron transport complex subunit D [Bacillota bacterium]
MPEETPRWKQRFADNREARDWNVTSLLMSLPLLLVGSYYYGAAALRNAVIAALTAVLCEAIAARLILRKRTIDDWNAVVTGVWIACMLPAEVNSTFAAPVYAAVGAVFAVLVVKIPFGGTMHAPFTPAAAGLAFLTVCFPKTVFNFIPSTLIPPLYDQSLASMLQNGRSVMGSKQLSGIMLGQSAGPMGTGCILLVAAALLGMLLLKKRRSAALASVSFIVVAAAVSFLFPRVTGEGMLVRLHSLGMELCSGSLLFAAVFLLPDPAIMPKRWYTRLGFGAVAGLLCAVLRQLGSAEETVCFAILLADAFMPLLYRIQAELRNQKEFHDRVDALEAGHAKEVRHG